MERLKEFTRQFRREDYSQIEADAIPNRPPSPKSGGRGQVGQTTSRIDSYPRASPSVEPPRIDRFLMYGSPAPFNSLNAPATIVLQQMPAIPETGNSGAPPLVSITSGNLYPAENHFVKMSEEDTCEPR
jgi:hypothetical protein